MAAPAERSDDGVPSVLASVHNTGGRALDMNGTFTLGGGPGGLSAGPGGLSAGPFPATLGSTLAIGDTEQARIELDEQLPAGPWDARITLRSGLVERSADAALTFPDVGQAAAVEVGARPAWLYPAVAVLTLLVLVLLAFLVWWRRRRRTDAQAGPMASATMRADMATSGSPPPGWLEPPTR